MARKTSAAGAPARRRRARPSAGARRAEAPAAALGPSAPAVGAAAPVTVRHYCQGLGDCHLLRFEKAGGGDFFMLIDCGVHSSVSGGSKTMARVVADIAERTGRRLDVLVVTHEHIDHVSGFLSAASAFAEFEVGEVWMGWTEDPADAQARALDTYRQQALAALQAASLRLDRAAAPGLYLSGLRTGLDALLGFSFGVKGERVRGGRDAAAALAKGRVRYFEPTDPPIAVAALPGLRIYVLGPPRTEELLRLDERESEMYAAAGGFGWPVARALSAAFRAAAPGDGEFDAAAPFDPALGTDFEALAASSAVPPGEEATGAARFAHARYFAHRAPDATAGEGEQSWRRIDLDWLGVSADLALQLDDHVNNTSLVLAFEVVETGRVLLFAADAQIGNWLSWQDLAWTVGDKKVVTGPDLLARTVYYKVGHHGSHNATPERKGLAQMTSRDLSAFIPTNERDAEKVGWGRMPYDKILRALGERCAGRVVRADDPWLAVPPEPPLAPPPDPPFTAPSGSIRALRFEPGLWVEFDVA